MQCMSEGGDEESLTNSTVTVTEVLNVWSSAVVHFDDVYVVDTNKYHSKYNLEQKMYKENVLKKR